MRTRAAIQPLEIFKLLKKSNCGECGLPTCLSFAQAVSLSEKNPADCPHLSKEFTRRITDRVDGSKPTDGFTSSIEELKARVRRTDLKKTAPILGAGFESGRLWLHVFGNKFTVAGDGEITSACHVNQWIQWLLLSYVSAPKPEQPRGWWVPFDELDGAATVAGYFSKRCEEPLRVIADEHTDVFFELLGLFGGKPVPGFDAHHSAALRPLPNVPMLILFWRAEDEFPSKLRVMFDPAAASYFSPELITGMGRGLVEMFQKIIPKHEKGVLNLPYV